jgi:hypothetical protein
MLGQASSARNRSTSAGLFRASCGLLEQPAGDVKRAAIRSSFRSGEGAGSARPAPCCRRDISGHNARSASSRTRHGSAPVAERIATEIYDAIHDTDATKGDVDHLRTDLNADITAGRSAGGAAPAPLVTASKAIVCGYRAAARRGGGSRYQFSGRNYQAGASGSAYLSEWREASLPRLFQNVDSAYRPRSAPPSERGFLWAQQQASRWNDGRTNATTERRTEESIAAPFPVRPAGAPVDRAHLAAGREGRVERPPRDVLAQGRRRPGRDADRRPNLPGAPGRGAIGIDGRVLSCAHRQERPPSAGWAAAAIGVRTAGRL